MLALVGTPIRRIQRLAQRRLENKCNGEDGLQGVALVQAKRPSIGNGIRRCWISTPSSGPGWEFGGMCILYFTAFMRSGGLMDGMDERNAVQDVYIDCLLYSTPSGEEGCMEDLAAAVVMES